MQTSLNFLIQRQQPLHLDKKKMFGLRSKLNSDVEYGYFTSTDCPKRCTLFDLSNIIM